MKPIQILKPTENITLENVKKSNYWELIALIVWNHYREKKYQNEKDIIISENYYGKHPTNGSRSYCSDWASPSYTEKDYIRTLGSIVIQFERSDYTTYIYLSVETGNVSYFGIYKDKTETRSPQYTGASTIQVMNWMLEHEFIKAKISHYIK